MKPAKQDPPVCCPNHYRRYMPIGETPEEKALVAAALEQWYEQEYTPGWDGDGRETLEDLPVYVIALRQMAANLASLEGEPKTSAGGGAGVSSPKNPVVSPPAGDASSDDVASLEGEEPE